MPIGKVLCLGGSLTVGLDSDVSGYRTFRGTLQNALATAGLTLAFIGPNSNAAAAGGNDANHAGWTDASIDSTGSSSNNLTARLSALKTDFPSPDLIIIDPPWWDIVNAPANLASRYSTFIGAVQSGAWASVKVVMCTAHPASGQTAAQTAGAYAAYSAVNAAMVTLRNASTTTRFIADLAALQTTSGGTSAALTERALWMAQKAPDFNTLEGGGEVANYWGGHFVCNWQGVLDYNATWTSNIPRNPNGSMLYPPPGGTGLMDPNVSSWNGTTNRFVQSVAGITPWYWIYCMSGHNASNTCVEVRNGFAAVLRPNGGGWRFIFSGSRFGDTGTWWNGRDYAQGSTDSRSRWGQRPDGLTTWHAPRGNVGIEVWPRDTVPSRGILEFNGGFNRDLLVGSLCWWWGAQCRLALIDPNGTDDRAQARFGVKCGGDLASSLGGRHYDQFGWPYNMQDIGSDAWTRVTWTDWEMVSAITLGREGSPSSGTSTEYHWNDQGAPGPMFGWSPPTPFNDPSAGRSLTASQIRQNPLPVPPHWEGGSTSGGTTVSGYQVTDYWQPVGGSRLYLLMQSGADKIAGIMSSAIVASGALSTFTGGGVVFELMQGLATRPNVFPKLNGSSRKNMEPKNRTTSTAPLWQTTSLPTAVVGVAYAGQLVAPADPAATFTIVSGAPGWLTCSSAGVLGGTPTGSATTHNVTFRATNAQGTVDVVLSLAVVAGLAITTTTLPNAVQGQLYSQTLTAVGAGPFTWAITVGALPAGLTLAGGVISGTPTEAGSASFTVRATDSTGATATQALSITVGASGSAPVITTATLPSGTVGVAYSQTIAATGSGTITGAVVSGTLPPGLSLNPTTRVLSGTPTSAGGYGFTVRATNAFGYVEATYYLSIVATPTAPVASPWAQFVRQ